MSSPVSQEYLNYVPGEKVTKLASVTVQAVDQIGGTAADAIEKAAGEIMRGAEEIRDNLLKLSEAVREHTKIAREQVDAFCEKNNHVFETIRSLDILRKMPAAEESPNIPVPAFLNQRTNGAEH